VALRSAYETGTCSTRTPVATLEINLDMGDSDSRPPSRALAGLGRFCRHSPPWSWMARPEAGRGALIRMLRFTPNGLVRLGRRDCGMSDQIGRPARRRPPMSPSVALHSPFLQHPDGVGEQDDCAPKPRSLATSATSPKGSAHSSFPAA